MRTTTRALLVLTAVAALPAIGAPRVQATEPAMQGAADDTKPDAAKDADNTGRNVRDRDDARLTPLDQGGSEADRTITQTIRKTIVDDDGMSTNAKNVKIITVDGVVTLRGPVSTAEERTAIASVAQKTAGVKRVDNQLEVEKE